MIRFLQYFLRAGSIIFFLSAVIDFILGLQGFTVNSIVLSGTWVCLGVLTGVLTYVLSKDHNIDSTS